MTRWMNIGQTARAAGVSTKMIRHYEQIGLIPAASRTDAGYRQYGERDISILRFIRQSRRLGFSMEQIAELMSLWSNRQRASREVKALAQGHLRALDDKMRELAAMRTALQALVHSCHGNEDPHCAILDDLAMDSPQAPEPEIVGGPALRKPRTRREREPAARAAPQRSATHRELMAWTRAAVHGEHRND